MKSDVSASPLFKDQIVQRQYYDLETPYGYGGPLCTGKIPLESQKNFVREIKEYCKRNNIVSLFFRFHPLLDNASSLQNVIDTKYLRDTIYINTEDQGLILKNMEGHARNRVRKAEKNNISIEIAPISEYGDFLDMYTETMLHNHADTYYMFDEHYFQSLNDLQCNANIFYAVLNGKRISGAIMLYNDRYMHYHLGGSHIAYRNLAPVNLLFYKAACWANQHGIGALHLGGGMAPEDNLYRFKYKFNQSGKLPFYVGRIIFDQEKYEELIQLRTIRDSNFDPDNNFMIQYRKP